MERRRPAPKPVVITVDSAAKWWGLVLSIATTIAGGATWATNQAVKTNELQESVRALQEDRALSIREWRAWREGQTRDMASIKTDIGWIREKLK